MTARTLPPKSGPRAWNLGVAVVVLLAGGALTGLLPIVEWWYGATPSQQTVLFIVLDTVRSDHLSLCGYERPTSPTLQQLASETSAWTCDAYAPGSWTLPSHASYFTGRDVPTHGAHFATEGRRVQGLTVRPLAEEFVTLAEKFRQRGFQTAGVSGNPVLTPATGLTQGFDVWEAARSFGEISGDTLVRQVKRVLRRASRNNDPLFLFVNIADAHTPWPGVPTGLDWVDPRNDYLDYFATTEPGEWEAYVADEMSELEATAFRQRMTDLYDYAVYRADQTLAGVLEAMDTSGWASAGLRLVITSDHGEFLGEHGLAAHGYYLWEPNNRVPLLSFGGTVPSLPIPVSATEVFALTLHDQLSPAPRSVAAAAFPGSVWRQRSGGKVGDSTSVAIWKSHEKFLWQDGETFRFDLRSDPSEQAAHPVEPDDPLHVDLLTLASRALTAQLSSDSPEPDDQLLERLRSLGYLR